MIKLLMVYPKNPRTFWSYDEALKIVGKRSMFPPTGLLTIAAMLPKDYDVRLIDENIIQLKDTDIRWADVILTSAMGIHKHSLQKIIERANLMHKPIMAGGPLPTQYHERIKGNATFFLGEAEAGFLEELKSLASKGYVPERSIIDKRGQFKSLNHAPIQRFELIKDSLKYYQVMAVQLTRGCPESCTFCNIGSLYGKSTRLAHEDKIIAELDALYDIGWRGSVMIVDDNVAGNQAALIPILNKITEWQKRHDYSFSFFTQASLRIFDNKELMEAMYQAGFGQVFFGIESPALESLKFMGAQKNIQDRGGSGLSIVEKLQIIGENYFKTMAGFIIGFDKDPDDIADMMIELITKSRMSIPMVGPLGILPDTADYTRYNNADRLVKDVIYSGDSGLFSRQLSYKPVDSKGNPIGPDVVTDRVKKVLKRAYTPKEYFSRTLNFIIHRKRKPLSRMPIRVSGLLAALKSFYHQGIMSDYPNTYWRYLWDVARHDIKDIPEAISYAVEGHHLIVITRETMKVDDVNKGIESLMATTPEDHPWINKGKGYVVHFRKRFKELKRSYGKIRHDFRPEVKGLDKLIEKYNGLFNKKRTPSQAL